MSHRPGRIPRSGLLRAKASTSEPSSRNILRKGFAVARAGTESEWIFPEGVFCGGSPWVRIMEIGSMNGRRQQVSHGVRCKPLASFRFSFVNPAFSCG